MTYKIGMIYDVAKQTSDGRTIGWAYYLRCRSLQKLCPPDMEIEIWQTGQEPWGRVADKDLVYNVEYANPSPKKYRNNGFKGVWVTSYNSDCRRRLHYWDNAYQHADFLICNNREMFEFKHRAPKTCCISNGYDTDLWYSEVPIQDRPHKLLWCGSSGARKGKRYPETFQPLEELAPQYGFETDFRPINDIDERVVRTYDDQRAWYATGSYILCASMTEGTPGYLGEAVACGCVAVTVRVGNAQEWLVHGENGVFCEWQPEAFIEALQYARENRERLSEAGMRTIRDGWGYSPPGDRAQYFFQLFRRLIQDGPASVRPFSFLEQHWSEI